MINRLYFTYDDLLAHKLARQYKPLALLTNPTVLTNDVSVIIPTIDTPETFARTLTLILQNLPREVIIVTIKCDLRLVLDFVGNVSSGATKVSVITAPHGNKREQMTLGIQAAKGKILAFVDDDVFWPTDAVLAHLVRGFEDRKVGGVAGPAS